MITQLKAIVDFKDAEEETVTAEADEKEEDSSKKEDLTDVLKTRIDTLNFSTRTLHALSEANIRTIGGVARKKKEDLLEIEGIGEKGIQEIRRILSNYGITLK